MGKLTFFLLLAPIFTFSQTKKEMYYTADSVFCSIEINSNDTIWKFGRISFDNQYPDSLTFNFFVEHEISRGLHYGKIETNKLSIQDYEFETNIVDNDFYRRKFGVLSSRFVFLLMENGDNFLRKSKDYTRDSVAYWYKGVSYFLSLVKNDSLQFLADQFSRLKSDNDFSSLAKKCFEDKDYESALFYSKLFLISNEINSESDMEIAMIFDLSNVAFELNNRYALVHPENEVLRDIIYRSSEFFPSTYQFHIVETE